MIVLDAFIVVVVLSVLGGVIYSINHRATVRAQAQPGVDRAAATSILERVLTVDEVSPVLPPNLRAEVEAFIAHTRRI